MKAFGLKEMLVIWVLFCLMGSFSASAKVVLKVNNVTTLSFANAEAGFAPSVKEPGIKGTLYVAKPLEACSPLTNVRKSNDTKSPFVLIIRGGCNFDDKVRKAQDAGFEAAIVYNNEDADLFHMVGNSDGIKIHAVLVSAESGETLAKYAGGSDMELWIVPDSHETWLWSPYFVKFLAYLCFMISYSLFVLEIVSGA